MLLGALVPFVVWVVGVFDNAKDKGMEGVILIFFIFMAILEFATLLTYGWYIERKTRDRITKHISDFDRLNIYDDGILGSEKHNVYISKTPLMTFSKYCVSDIGTVPRFTKLSYAIGKKFKQVKVTESKKAKALKSFE